VILALLFAANFVAPALAQPGLWHGREVAVSNGEKVLVLMEKSRLHCELEEQRVHVAPAKDVTDMEGQKNGKKVSLPHEHGWVAIIARVPGLLPGEVETVDVTTQDRSTPESPVTLTFHGVTWRIGLNGNDLVASDGKQKQILAHNIDKEGMPRWDLFWSGDMDHDGKLDLLYEIRGDNFSGADLALSSAAKRKGELMRVVASETHFGC
jgi:hypothetical protein